MIIECPVCGFTGRVPGYVAAVPHHARCPKCQHRFAIGERVARTPGVIEEGARRDLRHDLARPRLDPSSSSYEIEALTDEFDSDDDDERASHAHDWDDDWDGAIEPDDDAAPPPAVKAVRLPRFLLKGAEPPHEPVIGRRRLTFASTTATSWRFRLFETWAILFIIWAALIGSRAILATVSRDQDFLFSTATIWPVAAVVLLVTASAGLFLLIDLSRRFAPPPPDGVSARRGGAIEPAVMKHGSRTTG